MADDSADVQRQQRRAELRRANLAAWESGGIEPEGLAPALSEPDKASLTSCPILVSLDASLKRNTAFIKRLRTSLHAQDSVSALVKEVNALSLEKYTSELVSAAVEGLSRCKSGAEIAGAVEVISSLHQRFPELFSVPLVTNLQSALQPPPKGSLSNLTSEQRDRDETARILRQRGLLRIYAELEIIGVHRPDKRFSFGDATFNIFRELLTADKELLVVSIPLAIAFTKHLSSVFMSASEVESNPTPSEANEAVEGVTVTAQQRDKFKKLLSAYYEALSRRAVKDHTHLLETDRRNHDAYIRSGEIFEDRAQSYEKLVKGWEKLWAGLQSLSEALAVPLPTLPPLASNTVVTGTGNSLLNATNDESEGSGGSAGAWSDEEEKRFYTDLLDLRGEVPSSLLNGNKDGIDTTVKESELIGTRDTVEAKESTENVDAEDGIAPAPAAQLSALLARLPDMSNREAIDKAAVDFTFLNSKAARKRLIKLVAGVPRHRLDLLPYYARLVATLHQYMPDVGSGVVALLEDDFKSLQRRRAQDSARQDLAELRAKTVRFLSELAKFGVTPVHSILHVIKTSLDDFTGPSIENICIVLETCGRYLLRSEATREMMAAMLDTLKRKKNVTNLDQRYTTMLDNAYYQCDPPDRPVVVSKERTPMQLYIRHLLYDVLVKSTLDRVVKLLRKLHWEDPQVLRKLYNSFTKVWKIKFGDIYLFALVLHDLARYHSDFCVSVIDGVLENITVGMEHNNFKYNQQRVATVKYVGELYTYRMVDARLVLDTLWSLVTFGHPDGRPVPDTISSIDTPEDFFRVRLVCTLLDTCGVYFDRGLLRKKMDHFLVFFQMYIKSKHPLPMDIGFMVSDTFETLRPKMAIYGTFEEAAAAVDEIYATNLQHPELAELDLEEDGIRPEGLPQSSEDEAEAEAAPQSTEDESDFTDDDLSSSEVSSEDEAQMEEDDEFARELAKMMTENSGDIRKAATNRFGLSDVNLPAVKRQAAATESSDSGQMKFTLLMKKGSKQQTRSMDVPRESALAMQTMSKQERDRAEQQQLKRLVLDYEKRYGQG